jgi:hypothetical protein
MCKTGFARRTLTGNGMRCAGRNRTRHPSVRASRCKARFIFKDAKNLNNAQLYVDYAIQAKAQVGMPKELNYGPTNIKAFDTNSFSHRVSAQAVARCLAGQQFDMVFR